ncbi:MAG: ABC transporter permease [Candidatus Pacebacteria bacterium]|nr:ABC transporter permease [Candidatus Paceibacterota bacterium]
MPDTTKTAHHPVPDLVIKPSKGWGSLALDELWEYRDLLRFHISRNIKGKYRQMALGPLWIILQPIVNMVLFTFVFGKVARLPSEGIPYPIFTFVAILPWRYFATCTQSSLGSLVTNMNIISKVYFPRLVMPLSAAIAAIVDFLICFVIMIGLMLYFHYIPGWKTLLIPLYLLFAGMTGLGIGLWTASLTVRFRDLKLVANNGIRVAMYATPVAYSATLIAEKFPEWMWLYKLNPMYWVIEGFRWSLLDTGNPPELYMLIPIGLVVLLLITGAYVFRRTERTIVDLL